MAMYAFFFVLSNFVVCIGGISWTYNENSDSFMLKNISIEQYREKRFSNSGKCSFRDFNCWSGSTKCISNIKVCDGSKDCSDGSDESYNTCFNNTCSDFAFRCSYGACVDSDTLCDGKKDCVDNSDETHSDCAVHGAMETCKPTEFTCDSGECISKMKICDGHAECADQSDETSKLCQSNHCADFLFQCRYGACVDGDALCNGIVDCNDGSDEFTQCQYLKQEDEDEIIVEGCALPMRLRNGGYRSNKRRAGEGQLVPVGSFLTFYCNPGYVLRPARATIVQCRKTLKWTSEPPACIVECPTLSSVSQTITYSVPTGDPLVPQTTATLKCKEAYQPPPNDPAYRQLTCLDNGYWSKQVFNCTPKCGLETLNVKTLVVNGIDATAPDFPWNIGVYRSNSQYKENHTHICGGTIVSERLVISAAHCFYDVRSDGLNPKSEYFIGAGKVHRNWYEPILTDPHQQLRKVAQVLMHNEYKGIASSHINDIAYMILEAKDHLDFNGVVRPACIDWDNAYQHYAFQKNISGTVVGWGLTTPSGVRSDILKKISLPFIPKYPDCFESLPENVRHYLLHDKICAGTMTGSGVCQGDSGGGLMFRYHGNGLWYLRALVSFDPAFGDSCDPYSYTAFTDISYHIKWIQKYYESIL